jgi:glutamyl/glutaminyl-tRNA synthetase
MKERLIWETVRLACTGNAAGPSLYYLLEVMGKEKVMGRIEEALGQVGFGAG